MRGKKEGGGLSRGDDEGKRVRSEGEGSGSEKEGRWSVVKR